MKTNNTFNKIIQNSYFRYEILLFIGIFLGWVFFGRGEAPHSHDDNHAVHNHGSEAEQATVWTCAMHPQIKQDKPGKCPICGMDLTPMRSSANSDEQIDANAIQLSPEAIALANVETSIVTSQKPVKEVSLYGTIQADERLTQSQTAHVSGRIEKLLVNFTGESVRKGQTIAKIYSPDLLNAQQELIEAKKLEEVQPKLLEAAREKLRLWKLTDAQIRAVENSGIVSATVDIQANTSGIVIEKKVSEGDYINQGSVLFNVANFSQVWVMFDAYETDLPFLKQGDAVKFTVQAVPGKTFKGKISFIDPILNKTTRTAKVRVVTANPQSVLKPEMYANAKISSSIAHNGDQIIIPKSAVLWTGKRSIVYVKQPNIEASAFLLREIELGPTLGNSYIVLSGLDEGELIVTNGAFMIDASAQLEGKKSMMNDKAGAPQSGHTHHGSEQKATNSIESHKGTHEMLKVSGACDMCKERIEKAALSVSGVSQAAWDSKTQEVHLNFDSSKTNLNTISEAIATVGHDTEKHKADDAVYNALPGCCLYRK